eukprot:s5068_g8.t1
MRTRLWRCTPEQLRAADPSETLGRQLASDPALGELLRQVTAGTQARAVDVAREGPPSSDLEENQAPIQRASEGPDIAEGTQRLDSAADAPQQAPHEVPQVPPGLLPPPRLEPPPHAVRPGRRPSEPGPPPMELPGEGHAPSGPSSRRSSVQEPPETSAGLQPIPEESGRLGRLDDPRAEHHSEPPCKAPRISETTHASGAASSSQVGQRAPGTPMGPLLQAVRQGRPSASDEDDDSEELLPDDLYQTYERQAELSLFSFKAEQGWTLLANRNDEVDIRKLAQKEREMFLKSDQIEWEAILGTKAVRVAVGAEAQRLRTKYADRILSSRMVRRKKPTGDLHQWKAKSRWCLHGHADPDSGQLITYAPTPQVESMMLFLQCGLSLGHNFSFCDVKNAFCQSLPLRRPRGPLFAEPCEGLNLPEGALIVIEIPVYGLDDAPAAWRETVTRFLVEDMKFVRSLVEPCWFFRHNSSGVNEAQVLVEVDDFIVSTEPRIRDEIRQQFEARFHFGKWELDSADYAGRRVRVLQDKILVDQEKYILEQLQPISLAKGRRAHKDEGLLPEEHTAFRSMIYRISWVGKECRPEMCGLASIMASRLDQATVSDALIVNQCVNHLRNTASRALTIWKIKPDQLSFIVVSDAGGIGAKHETQDELGLPADATQGAWMVVAAECLPIGEQKVRASPLRWRSSKLKRKVYSTFGGETQAMLQGLAEADWLQIMLRDALHHDVKLRDWRNSLSPHMLVMRSGVEAPSRQPQCSVTDAKSLFDCLLKEHPQGRQDRRSALELAIIVKDLQETKSMVRWTPHQKMLVDALTKVNPLKSNGALDCFLKTGLLSLVDERLVLSGGKFFCHPDVPKPLPPAFPCKRTSQKKPCKTFKAAMKMVRPRLHQALGAAEFSELQRTGVVRVRSILHSEECAQLLDFASRANFPDVRRLDGEAGRGGAYHFCEGRAPPLVEAIRTSLYESLLEQLPSLARRFGKSLAELEKRCRAAGQRRSATIFLAFGEGGVNLAHQDPYGLLFFPYQAVLMLSKRGQDFNGGEFFIKRMNSGQVVEVASTEGDLILFAANKAAVHGTDFKHGVREVRGTRFSVGIVFNLRK